MPRLRPPFPAEQRPVGQAHLHQQCRNLRAGPVDSSPWCRCIRRHRHRHQQGHQGFLTTGKVNRAGLIEVPMGTTIRQIVEEIGGGIIQETPAAEMLPGFALPPRHVQSRADRRAVRRVHPRRTGGCAGGLRIARGAWARSWVPAGWSSWTTATAWSISPAISSNSPRPKAAANARPAASAPSACWKSSTALPPARPSPMNWRHWKNWRRRSNPAACAGWADRPQSRAFHAATISATEYEAHLQGRCPAGRCTALVKYVVNDACVGCTRCARSARPRRSRSRPTTATDRRRQVHPLRRLPARLPHRRHRGAAHDHASRIDGKPISVPRERPSLRPRGRRGSKFPPVRSRADGQCRLDKLHALRRPHQRCVRAGSVMRHARRRPDESRKRNRRPSKRPARPRWNCSSATTSGPCVAPCQSVCPAHMHIDRMLDQIAARELGSGRSRPSRKISPCRRCWAGYARNFAKKAAGGKATMRPVSICRLKREAADRDLASPTPYRPAIVCRPRASASPSSGPGPRRAVRRLLSCPGRSRLHDIRSASGCRWIAPDCAPHRGTAA